MSSVNKARNICRTCLSSDGDFIPLFSYISKTSRLANKIMNISNVTMNAQDGLPHMICKKCIFLVESFDCFKKQIESANEKMTQIRHGSENQLKRSEIEKLKKIDLFIEEDEDSESDYEVQYISDEVKKRVENAIRRKRRTYIMNQIAALNFNYMHLSKYHNALLFAIKDLGNGKKKANKDYYSMMSEFMKEIPQTNEIEIEEECTVETALSGVEVEKTQTEGFEDDIEPETLQSANSDCNERLVIAVEDFDESEMKIQDMDCTESEENLMHEKVANSMPENAKNIEEQGSEAFAGKIEDKHEILENVNNVEQQSLVPFNRNSTNENEIPKHVNAKTMVENIGQFQHFFYRDKTKSLPFQSHFDNGIENSMPETHGSIEKKIPEQCNIDSAGDRGANFQSGNLENFRENMSDNKIFYENEEDDMMVDNPLSIHEEVVETSKCEKEEETYEEIIDKNHHGKNFYHETLNYENVEDNSGTRIIEKKEKDPLELSNNGEETDQVGKLKVVEKNVKSEEQLVEFGKSNECDEESSRKMTVKTHENLPFKKKHENLTSEKTKLVDVIVISSDSSDEERLKNYKDSGNQGVSRVARRAKKKMSQPPPAVRKIIRVPKGFDQKALIGNGKTEATVEPNKKFQPKKYFHCTSCNIYLYSVSAVLHHHNKIHTLPEELLHCQMCDVKFASKTILQAHFDHHHETHLFRCNFCACEFVLKRNLRAHMNAHLKPKVEEPENKRLKIDEPCEKLQLPVQEHNRNQTNDNFSAIQNIETDRQVLDQERND